MKKILIILTCFLIATNANAQYKYDYTWLFGQYKENWKAEGTIINFNTSPFTIDSSLLGIDLRATNAMLSDENGKLILYSNGCYVFGGDQQMIEFGKYINAGNDGETWDHYCPDISASGYPAGPKGVLFLPVNGKTDSVLILHLFSPANSYDYFYKYSVAIKKPNGKYSLPFNLRNQLLNKGKFYHTGSSTPLKYKKNSWLFNTVIGDSSYYQIYLIDGIKIDSLKTIKIKELPKRYHNTYVEKFSPNGKLYAEFHRPLDSSKNEVVVLNFDRDSVMFSYKARWKIKDSENGWGGLEFSPDSRYLYVSIYDKIFQYDLQANDIASSETIIAEFGGFFDPAACNFYRMQLGPDCRIYVTSTNSQRWLHIINKPDKAGKDCDVKQHFIPLHYYHLVSIPYFPNYRLDTPYPVCDSTIALPWMLTATDEIGKNVQQFEVNPTLAKSEIRIILTNQTNAEPMTAYLINILGQVIKQSEIKPLEDNTVINVEDCEMGMYFVVLKNNKGQLSAAKKVLVVK